jgi:hypothetical protein
MRSPCPTLRPDRTAQATTHASKMFADKLKRIEMVLGRPLDAHDVQN